MIDPEGIPSSISVKAIFVIVAVGLILGSVIALVLRYPG